MTIDLKGVVLATLGAVLGAVLGASSVQAQSAGDNVLSVGLAHFQPTSQSTELMMTSFNGVPANVGQGGTVKGSSGDLPAFTFEHYFSDHIGVAFIGGVPGKIYVNGQGPLTPFGRLGQATLLAPQLNMRYHLGQPDEKFRPFLGLGLNYTAFADAKITNGNFVTTSYGPGGSAKVKAASSWNPVVEVGFDYKIADHWSIGTALSYMPTSTKLKIEGHTAGGDVIVSDSDLHINPVSVMVTLGYRF